MREKELREELLQLARKLVQEGLVVRTWGNLSAKLDEETLLVTPSGRSYAVMEPQDLVKVSIASGKRAQGESGKPSSEAPMHALVYRLREEAHFVIHTHQIFASALSLSPREFALKGEWAECFGARSLPVSTYALPGTKKLHKGVEEALSRSHSKALLMGRHGGLILGDSLEDCFSRAVRLEAFSRAEYRRITGEEDLPRESIDADRSDETALANEWHVKTPDFVSISTDPAVLALEQKVLHPYLDDFAQICGVSVSSRRGSSSAIFPKRESYAVCFGSSEKEARSVRAVLEKNARAARIATAYGQAPIPGWENRLMRLVYQKKYSKLSGE